MALSLCTKSLLNLSNSVLRTQCRNAAGYYILLPELGQQVTDKLKLSVNDSVKISLPNFGGIDLETVANVVETTCLDYKTGLQSIEKAAKGKEVKDVFKDVLDSVEKMNISLDSMWGVVKVLFTVDNQIVTQELYQSIKKKVDECKSSRFNNAFFYSICKNCDTSKLTEEQVRVVQKYVLEGRLNGIELQMSNTDQLTDFNSVLYTISRETRYFGRRFQKACEKFRHTITDPQCVAEFPKEILTTMVAEGGTLEEGPWDVTINPIMSRNFLKYCPDRDLRWNFWQGEERVCSQLEKDPTLKNSLCLETIRKSRRVQANCLGYPSYFHMGLETKMAGSLENVEDTLYFLLSKARNQQDAEVDDLQEFMQASVGGKHPVQLFDVPYWERLQKKELFNFDEQEQKVYFPLPTVLQGLFDLCSKLFHISFKEETKGVSTWHPDVKFYHIFKNEESMPCGAFYLDLIKRDSKTFYGSEIGWSIPIRDHSLVPTKTSPLSALIFNFNQAEGKKPVLLTISQVKSLFARFAFILQNALCEAAYSDVAGIQNVEWDAVESASYFLASWLYDESVFESINGHYETGEKLKLPLKALRQHMSGFHLCHQLFKANLDIQLHATNKFWVDILKEIWDDHYAFPLAKWNSYPCQFTDIFADQWAGAYYSHVWSHMLAADVFSAFHEENQDIESTGLRYRDTFLAFGGSCHASEVFRRFRGRDPNPSALLKQLGMIIS